jgi:ribosomal-protein-alanine N-acetyltransferase
MRDDESIVIEQTTGSDDLDAVASLESASFTNPWTREMLARELERSDITRVYVLRLRDRRVVAFCACWVIHDELHINTIAVDVGVRRHGLASRLMEHVLREAAREGARRATLEVRRSNEAALALYQRLGFAVTAVRPRYYSQPEEDALILWREEL